MELHQTPPPLRLVVLAHRAVRRDLLRLAALVATTRPDPGAVAGLYRWYRAFRAAVEDQCAAEVAVLVPALERAGRTGLAGSLRDRHDRVGDALEVAAEAVELLSDADGDRLPALLPPARVVVGHLGSVLGAYGHEVESAVLPAIVGAFEAEELAPLGPSLHAALRPEDAWFHRCWLVSALGEDEAGALAGTPLGGVGPDAERDRYRRLTRPLAPA